MLRQAPCSTYFKSFYGYSMNLNVREELNSVTVEWNQAKSLAVYIKCDYLQLSVITLMPKVNPPPTIVISFIIQ